MMIFDLGPEDIHYIPEIFLGKGILFRIWQPEEMGGAKETKATLESWGERAETRGNQDWPTYWLYRTNQLNTPQRSKTVPRLHFLALNRKPRPHRRAIMSLLQQQGLLESNLYSWLEYRNDWFLDHETPIPVKVLDTMQSEDDMWRYLPEYHDTAMSLVFETYEDTVFITEKTFIQFHNSRFFLPYGGPGTVQCLRDWGFVFPETVDFEYDRDLPKEQRRRLYVESVSSLVDRFTPKELWLHTRPTVLNNRLRFQQIVQEKKMVPRFNLIPYWARQLKGYVESIA